MNPINRKTAQRGRAASWAVDVCSGELLTGELDEFITPLLVAKTGLDDVHESSEALVGKEKNELMPPTVVDGGKIFLPLQKRCRILRQTHDEVRKETSSRSPLTTGQVNATLFHW